MSKRFDELRGEIDATDAAIVGLVNRRLAYVAELWELKRKQGIDRIDPDREASLRAALAAANTGPLSEAGLERLVTEVLAITKAELGRGRSG